MSAPSNLEPNAASGLWHSFLARFSLLDDKADDSHIDTSLRGGVELRGATPWILIFAIVIASIGLNVNSTAVIIGAMLISPLMGPIMGLGYGIGIYDFTLIHRSVLNLAIAALISLLTSTLYFTLTPLTEAHSELLARTSPTIWDVLIALFGGFAGIIGVTRKEKSNVIPGVAIATALMPPLCTAGYGLAKGNWPFFLGAIYLFSINCVFITFATVLVIGFLNPPHKKFIDPRVESRVKRALLAVVVLTTLPSLYLAYRLVGNEVFQNRARHFVLEAFDFPRTHVIETVLDPKTKHIEVTVIGDRLAPDTVSAIRSHLSDRRLKGATLTVHQGGDAGIDLAMLRARLEKDLNGKALDLAAVKDQEIQSLKDRIVWTEQASDLSRELKAQFPDLTDVVVGEGAAGDEPASLSEVSSEKNEDAVSAAHTEMTETAPVPVLIARSPRRMSSRDVRQIERWFQARTRNAQARVAIS